MRKQILSISLVMICPLLPTLNANDTRRSNLANWRLEIIESYHKRENNLNVTQENKAILSATQHLDNKLEYELIKVKNTFDREIEKLTILGNLEDANRLVAEKEDWFLNWPYHPPVADDLIVKEFVVSSRTVFHNAMPTGIFVNKGDAIKFYPDKAGRWTGGGSRAGKYCSYRGYTDRGVGAWMSMKYRIGDSIYIVDEGLVKVKEDGEIKLYCYDDKASGNFGEIKVGISVQ